MRSTDLHVRDGCRISLVFSAVAIKRAMRYTARSVTLPDRQHNNRLLISTFSLKKNTATKQ